MRKLLVTVFCILLVLGVGAGAWAADTLDKVKEDGVLVVGVLGDTFPFGFQDEANGPLIGYDVDYSEAIADKLGVEIKLVEIPAFNRFAALLDGEVDIVAAALNHSELSSSLIGQSDHYLVSGQKVIARKGLIKTHDDLARKRIGAVVGTFSEVCARDRCTVSTVVPFDTYLEGIMALKSGDVDVFTSDESILLDLFSSFSLSEFEIPDMLILNEEYHLGVRMEDDNLRESVNKAIAELIKSGEAKTIRDKWFVPPEEQPPASYGAVVRKASTSQRYLGLTLQGILYPGSEVSIFSLDGKELGSATIASIIGDEFYVDVEPAIADVVRPGFLVAMNMTNSMALDVLSIRGGLLKKVKYDSDMEESSIKSEIEREALEKQRLQLELDTYKKKSRIEDRNDYFRGFRRYRYR